MRRRGPFAGKWNFGPSGFKSVATVPRAANIPKHLSVVQIGDKTVLSEHLASLFTWKDLLDHGIVSCVSLACNLSPVNASQLLLKVEDSALAFVPQVPASGRKRM